LLLDVHFRADAVCRAHILQAHSLLRRDELPLIEDAIVRAQRRRGVICLAAVTDDAILIQDLRPFGEAHRAPVSVARPELATDRGAASSATSVSRPTCTTPSTLATGREAAARVHEKASPRLLRWEPAQRGPDPRGRLPTAPPDADGVGRLRRQPGERGAEPLGE